LDKRRCDYCLQNRLESSFGTPGTWGGPLGPWCKFCDRKFSTNSTEELIEQLAAAAEMYAAAQRGEQVDPDELDKARIELVHKHAREAYVNNRRAKMMEGVVEDIRGLDPLAPDYLTRVSALTAELKRVKGLPADQVMAEWAVSSLRRSASNPW